jgi:hypothetical protein
MIPSAAFDDARRMIPLSDDALFSTLGSRLVASGPDAGRTLGPGDSLRRRGEDYFERVRDRLARRLCPEWRGLLEKDVADQQDVVTALLPLIVEALGFSDSQTSVAAVLVVIVVRRGVDALCSR